MNEAARHLCYSSSRHMLSCLKSIKKLEMESGVHVLCLSPNSLYLHKFNDCSW